MTEIDVEEEYQRRIAAMAPWEKVARSAAMFAWTRQQMAARIRKENPELSDEQLKWYVALELYQDEPQVVEMIKEHLKHVSG